MFNKACALIKYSSGSNYVRNLVLNSTAGLEEINKDKLFKEKKLCVRTLGRYLMIIIVNLGEEWKIFALSF